MPLMDEMLHFRRPHTSTGCIFGIILFSVLTFDLTDWTDTDLTEALQVIKSSIQPDMARL